MTTAPDLAMPTTITADDPAQTAEAPRIKLSSHGFSIEHSDPDLGEQLMANALGTTDREATDGLLRQLIRASVNGGRADEANLSFMISMIKGIKPRDAVEAMLVAQMVSVHVMAMRCAHHLANADDLAQHDSAARALGRLARTFPAQIEALNRYRSQSEPAITVQNVKVEDGGNAIVGNVTQHARVIVADKRAGMRGAEGDAAPRLGLGLEARASSRRQHGGSLRDERSRPHDQPDAGEPAMRRQDPSRRPVPRAGGARQTSLPHARRRTGIRSPQGKPERAQARAVHAGSDRGAQADSGVAG